MLVDSEHFQTQKPNYINIYHPGITYTAYRNVFPIWALGRCMATYGDLLND
jgi:hypothetical protein